MRSMNSRPARLPGEFHLGGEHTRPRVFHVAPSRHGRLASRVTQSYVADASFQRGAENHTRGRVCSPMEIRVKHPHQLLPKLFQPRRLVLVEFPFPRERQRPRGMVGPHHARARLTWQTHDFSECAKIHTRGRVCSPREIAPTAAGGPVPDRSPAAPRKVWNGRKLLLPRAVSFHTYQ